MNQAEAQQLEEASNRLAAHLNEKDYATAEGKSGDQGYVGYRLCCNLANICSGTTTINPLLAGTFLILLIAGVAACCSSSAAAGFFFYWRRKNGGKEEKMDEDKKETDNTESIGTDAVEISIED
uniref:CX domain-containing protein n=1 Tax=Caenorhabditis tropicalis TaxID=1561998 RepID=A0A1I7TGU0_9PELO